MLLITTSHSAEAAKNYLDVALKTSDYYTKDVGIWGGKGAEILELKVTSSGRIQDGQGSCSQRSPGKAI